MLFDSLALFQGLNISTILQISRIYNSIVPPNECLQIHKVSVQQQVGLLDCGLFSIAFALEVCVANNPQHVTFDQSQMRQHLYTSLTKGIIKPFPKLSTATGREGLPRPASKVVSINLYCECRMPEAYDDMVCCDSCDTWFHIKCMNLRINRMPKTWMCNSCTV